VTAWWIWTAVSVFSAALVGWVVPFWVMKRFVPVLERFRKTTNYRGHQVFTGLGLVWLVWAAAYALVGGLWSGALGAMGFGPAHPGFPVARILYDLSWSAAPIALVIGALALGLVDDVFGDSAARGFRGHLAALREGRVTTGALKMFGIGALAVGAAVPAMAGPARASSVVGSSPVTFVAAWALAALAIALCANLINQADLRPGLALKSFSALAVVAILATVWRVWALGSGPGYSQVAGWLPLIAGAVLAVLVFGPVASVWRYDLGEQGMLGDAGANAMGALVGYLLASNLPLWLLALAVVVLIVLNIASEKVTLLDVIEHSALLRRIDRLGRLPDDARPGSDTGRDGGS
jgi:hypothetical protein